MPTPQEINRAKFVSTFNELIGNRKGTPISYVSDKELSQGSSSKNKLKAALLQAPKLKEPTKKTSSTATVGKTSASDLAALLTQDVGSSSTGPEISASGFNEGGGGGGLLNSLKHLGGKVFDNPVSHFVANNPVTDFAGDALEKTIEAVSRPGYAVNEGLRNTYESINAGEPVWSLGDDFLYGAWNGLKGEKKTGFGQAQNEEKFGDKSKHSTSAKIALALPQFLGLNPQAAGIELTTENGPVDSTQYYKDNPSVKWEDRFRGAVGDVLTDPTTYYGGEAVTAAKSATGKTIKSGVEAVGKEAIKEETSKVFREILDQMNDPILNATKATGKAAPLHRVAVKDLILKSFKEKLDSFTYDLKNGRVIGGTAKDAHGTLAQAGAEAIRDSYFKSVMSKRNKFVDALKAGKKPTSQELQVWRKNPLMNDWLDAAEQATKEAKHARQTVDTIAERADKIFLEKLSPKVDEVYGKLLSELDNTTMKIPKISFMGHDTYLPKMGKALNEVKGIAGDRFSNLNKAFNYSSWFPGYSSHIAQKVKSMNIRKYEDFRNFVREALKETSKADRVEIHKAIEEGRQLTGHLAYPQRLIEDGYKDIFNEEVAKNFRDPLKTPRADNYVYNRLTSGVHDNDKLINDWRNLKKASVLKNKSIDGFTSKEAKALKYGVDMDAGEALLARKAKSLRELSRIEFKKDLVSHYGIKARIPVDEAKSRNLKLLDRNEYPEAYKGLDKTENIYLDKDIEQVYRNYRDLSSLRQTSEANDLVKAFDKLTRIFKSANTIYWPGFHVRNLVSDVFMGALDGVKSSRYTQVFNAMLHRSKSKLKVAGESVPFNDVYESYYNKAASSGFFDTEMNINVDKNELSSTRFMNTVAHPTQITKALRKASTVREDFGRFVHYYHALDDEMTSLMKKGMSRDKAWTAAEEAALSRVNKFKFDYNALTPTEQKIRQYGMPFYTYMRKATPVLLENLFMNPRYFSYINKLQQSLAPTEEFQGAQLPSWMKETAFSQLTGGDEPVGFTDALSPTRTLKESFSNPASKLNPIIQAPFEYGNKDTFTGKPVGTGVTGLADILKNKWRGTSTYRSAESNTKPTLEKWYGFFGIPIVQVTKARQESKLNELNFQLSQKVKKINTKLEARGLKLSVRKNRIYVVQPKTDDKPEKILGIYDTFDEIPLKL